MTLSRTTLLFCAAAVFLLAAFLYAFNLLSPSSDRTVETSTVDKETRKELQLTDELNYAKLEMLDSNRALQSENRPRRGKPLQVPPDVKVDPFAPDRERWVSPKEKHVIGEYVPVDGEERLKHIAIEERVVIGEPLDPRSGTQQANLEYPKFSKGPMIHPDSLTDQKSEVTERIIIGEPVDVK